VAEGACQKLGGEGEGDGTEGCGRGHDSRGQLSGQELDTTINGRVARRLFQLDPLRRQPGLVRAEGALVQS